MFEVLWKELGTNINRRWITNAFAPALLFWVVILASFLSFVKVNLSIAQWNGLNIIQQIFLVGVGFLLIIVTATLLELFQPSFTRLYAGHWTVPPFSWVRNYSVHRIKKNLNNQKKRYSELALKITKDNISESEKYEYEKLERFLSDWPTAEDDIMPTLLGNVLKVSEAYSYTHYGLDAVTIWPRLYFQISEDIKEALTVAYGDLCILIRISLLSLVTGVIWIPLFLIRGLWLYSLLFILWFVISWFCYKTAIEAAKRYGTIIKIAFDLHRFDLYEALHWPLPKEISSEVPSPSVIADGQKLSLFLRRYQWIGEITYKHKKENSRK